MGNSWLFVANGRRSEECEQSMTEEAVNGKKTSPGIDEMHYWWKILLGLLVEKNVLSVLHLSSLSYVVIQILQRGTEWSFSFLAFLQLCLPFLWINRPIPFCLNLPVLAPLHSPFILTYSNSSLANELHAVFLSKMQNFVSCLGHWMTSVCRWGKSVRIAQSFMKCHYHGKRTWWASKDCT